MFFQLAVIGPIAAGGLGMARQCLGCWHARNYAQGACAGFGPGCLGYRPIRINTSADGAPAAAGSAPGHRQRRPG